MTEQFNADWARGIINGGAETAKSFIEDPAKIDELIAQLMQKMEELPSTVAESFANVPLMAQMVKGYVTQEYTDVSPKVVVSLVAAFLYLVKQRDLIPDYIPVVGFLDDLAIITFALAINKPELEAYAQWKAEKDGEEPFRIVDSETL